MLYLTRGKVLDVAFATYIEQTPFLLLYKLGPAHIPYTVRFPKAERVALINCNRRGVFDILTPHAFPAVREIYYLSAHPGSYTVCERFQYASQTPTWYVPEKSYPFFTYLEAKVGARRVPNLLSAFVTNKRIVDGAEDFDISFYFDLRLPEGGIVDGERYRDQFHEYLALKQALYYAEEAAEMQ